MKNEIRVLVNNYCNNLLFGMVGWREDWIPKWMECKNKVHKFKQGGKKMKDTLRKIKERFKPKDRVIYYKQKGNELGVAFLNFSLYERIEICINIIASGYFSQKADAVDNK